MISIKMTGTDKQIEWANDILNNPVQELESMIANNERYGIDLHKNPAYRAAIAEYESFILAHADKLSTAKSVIDRRGMFQNMLKESVRNALAAMSDNRA